MGHAFEALDAVARIIVSPSEACSEFAALAFPDEEVRVDALLADLARPGPGSPRRSSTAAGCCPTRCRG
ncbi:hypothetical protein G7085_13000 [Tessaracoccus sp. HDW20]|uniref:hypothetical protein n=1 Tax=Tessaracoccus coleopterorum TaxID=2714950 RepID=UPI0018D4A100|nr:hypothetical protein [Tessaracoccus coleopterorum]NHB85234.1 hypothetical protein [Tessaracoccus coleopterorum]